MKITRPKDPGASTGPRVSAYDKAREAAIEKQLSQYVELNCSHFITWEDDMRYSFNRPDSSKMWCDTCGKWRTQKAKPEPKPLPQEPLF